MVRVCEAAAASATMKPPEALGRSGRPAALRSRSSGEDLDHFAIRVANGDLQRHLPWQRVRGATEARVIQPEGHLDAVQQTLMHDRALWIRLWAAFLIDIAIGA